MLSLTYTHLQVIMPQLIISPKFVYFSKVRLFSHISPKSSYMIIYLLINLTCFFYVHYHSNPSITTSFQLRKPYFILIHVHVHVQALAKVRLKINIMHSISSKIGCQPLIHQNSKFSTSKDRIGTTQVVPKHPKQSPRKFLHILVRLAPDRRFER